MSDEAPVFQETITSAAIDGARISAITAQTLVEMDPTLSDELREEIVVNIEAARIYLDQARKLFQVRSTSVHVVSGAGAHGGIIVP
jgi:hypothetical protein